MPKKKSVKKTVPKKTKSTKAPEFLVDLLNARSPTGAEYEAQEVVDRYVEQEVDLYRRDTMGCLLYTSPSPRDATLSRMPSSA